MSRWIPFLAVMLVVAASESARLVLRKELS